jgi:hypothetical protein
VATLLQQFDGDGVTLTFSNGVPVAPSSSLLRAQMGLSYDDQGRVYQTQVYDVNPSTGATGSNTLATYFWYNHRGDLMKEGDPKRIGRWTVVASVDCTPSFSATRRSPPRWEFVQSPGWERMVKVMGGTNHSFFSSPLNLWISLSLGSSLLKSALSFSVSAGWGMLSLKSPLSLKRMPGPATSPPRGRARRPWSMGQIARFILLIGVQLACRRV